MKSSSRRKEALTFDRSGAQEPGGLSLLTSAATTEFRVFKQHLRAGLQTNCRACASRRAETVETAGIIRPLGIAEIERVAGERVGLHRNPVHHVGRAFHH